MSISSIQVYGTNGPEFTATPLKIADYTASSGDWVLCDTNAAAGNIDLILPVSPAVGDAVKITLATAHATRIVTINRNSSTIDGGTAAEYQDYNKLWKTGDTVTFRCVAASAWVTSERQIANRFMFKARRTTAQAITSATFTKAQFSTEDYDMNGNFDPATNYDYTIPISGKYFFSAVMRFEGITDASTVLHAVYVDGTATQEYTDTMPGGTNNQTSSLVTTLDLTVGQVVTVYSYQATGSNKNLNTSFWSMNLISR